MVIDLQLHEAQLIESNVVLIFAIFIWLSSPAEWKES